MKKPGTILVIDDSRESLSLLEKTLSSAGYQVRPSDSGELGLASVAASQPDLILLDIRMPIMDGFEVCRRLKASEKSRNIPVIFLSSLTEAHERTEGLKMGAVDFISKPFSEDEMLARVSTHMELSQLRAHLENAVALRTAELQSELSERKRVEAELERQRKFSQLIIDKAHTQLVYLDADFNFVAVNNAYTNSSKKTPEDLIGKNHFDVFPNEENKAIFMQVRESGESISFQDQPFTFPGQPERGITYWDWTLTPVKDAAGQVEGLVLSLVETTERKQAEEKLIAALAEKETLLRELYHRTKNNMQVITAMLALEEEYLDDSRLSLILEEMRTRIMSMAMVHQKLYQSRNLSNIDLGDYISNLAELLMKSYRVADGSVSLVTEVEPIPASIDVAIPCGLLLNELVSNALKYAFPHNHDGQIKVSLTLEKDFITLTVSDNGIGFPEGFDIETSSKLGLQMVMALGQNQLQGQITFSHKKGVSCKIRFPNSLNNER